MNFIQLVDMIIHLGINSTRPEEDKGSLDYSYHNFVFNAFLVLVFLLLLLVLDHWLPAEWDTNN